MKRKVVFYVSIFLLSLFCGLFVQPLNLDEIWNYGFAHNIYNGLVPYKDFNMVITPFFPMLMSLGFHLFGSNILILYIENSIILTILIYLVDRIIGKKFLLIALLLLLPGFVMPSYNIFMFFILILLLLLEKNNQNDFFIGIVLGIGILTKQSVGCFLVLPSLLYIKNWKKLLLRICGILIPILLFLIFLLSTNSFNQFMDLCFFGLIDFASDNHLKFNINYVLFVIFIIVCFYFIRKDKSNIFTYYCLSFVSIMIPLFDLYHTFVAFLGVFFLILLNYKFKSKINLYYLFYGITVGISFILLINYPTKIVYPNDINHFEYKLIDKESILFTRELNVFFKDNKDKKIICLNGEGYYLKIVNDIPITYYDLLNRGNWGYNGSEKIKKSILSEKNTIFLVDNNALMDDNQTDKQILKYVLKNGKKIGNIRIYDIYILE